MLVFAVPPLPSRAEADSFIDDNGSRFEAYIERARQEGLVVGCNPPANDRVCPNDPMTRGEMVLLLARGVGLTPPSPDPFVTGSGRLGAFAVSALDGAGIPTGCDPGASCPDTPITREEMAALFARAFRWGSALNVERFRDVSQSRFTDAIVNLVDEGGLLACDSPVDERLCPRWHVRRDEAIFALVSVLDLGPAASARPEPELPAIGFEDAFDSLALWDGRAPSHRNRVRLTSSGYRKSGLRVTIPRGSHFGADFKLRLRNVSKTEPERLYFRYYLKLDADWRSPSSGKLPGFSGIYGSTGKGGYQSSPTDPGWSARLMFSPNSGTDNRVKLGYYVYHLGQERRYGDSVGWNEAGKLQPGQWYCLEGQVGLNTLGLADGSLKAWVDGTPALDFSGLEFRRPEEPEIRIESFWFNVYYGGKTTPDRNLGMAIDEVVVDTHRIGCGAGTGTSSPVEGDFDGDGYPDVIRWTICPEGTCLSLDTRSPTGSSRERFIRDTAWFSLETHRFGLFAGDVDGDGEEELVYRGRCPGSTRCWRVHLDPDSGDGAQDWGDGARFTTETGTPLLGDWNGDGLDDLAYQGTCGGEGEAHACWRVHTSTGTAFAGPTDWGSPPRGTVAPQPVDLDGNGRKDLLFRESCDGDECWYAQLSDGSSFAAPMRLGRVTDTEMNDSAIFDFDGNGTDDIVSWEEGESPRIIVRFGSPAGFGEPLTLALVDGRIIGTHLERATHWSPVQATLQLACGDGVCTERLFAPSHDRLVDFDTFRRLSDTFRRLSQHRLGVPAII